MTRQAWSSTAPMFVALLGAMSIGVLFVALPYFASNELGANQTEVGLIGALISFCYVVAILLGRKRFDHFNPRYMATVSNSLMAVCAFAMCIAPSWQMLAVMTALYGFVMSWHWPPIMGWISTGAEGAALNRRLGWFNAAWSSGLIIGPLIGGWLYELSIPLCFSAAAVMHISCVGLLMSTRRNDVPKPLPAQDGPQEDSGADSRTAHFRRVARVGLVCGYVVFGLLRYQLPGLAQHMGLAAEKYAPIAMTFSASMALGFVVLGKSHAWHYRGALIWIIQAILACVLILAYVAPGPGLLYLCAALAGPCTSFLYASHLFYGVSGGRNRARLMAVHETLLSVGFLTGALGGGIVADISGIRAPYVACCAVLLCGVVVEYVLSSSRSHPTPQQ